MADLRSQGVCLADRSGYGVFHVGPDVPDTAASRQPFALTVGESISAHEFGAVVQMLGFGLRLLGANQMNVELRVEDETAAS